MTDRGRVRRANEDQFLIAALLKTLRIERTSLPQPREQRGSDQCHLYVVADGMGGHAGGSEASALAVDSVERFVLDTLQWFAHCKGRADDLVLSEFRKALGQANARVLAESAERPELHGMGTTLTLAYVLNGVLFVAHVGDSRCYLLREGLLYRLTHDHTLVEAMVRRGMLKPEEAATHHWRHVVTNVVGGDSPEVQIDLHKVQLDADDRLLLCSDGLTGMVSEEKVTSVLATEVNPQAACRKLVATANESGGKDNITVIVAHFSGDSSELVEEDSAVHVSAPETVVY
jgi:protein phosphatase